MKHKFKIVVFLGVLFFALFSACHDDDLHDNLTNQPQETSTVSSEELLQLLKNPDIENAIRENKGIKKGNNDLYFEKLDFQDFDNYTLFIDSYTAETPYYKSLVVTIDNNNTEDAFYVQYTPTEPGYDGSQPFSIKKFIGQVDVTDLEGRPRGSWQLNQGSVTEVFGEEDCVTSITISIVPCSHGGGHEPGESCNNGYVNDSYYLVSVTVRCNHHYIFAGGGSFNGGGALPSASTIFYNKLSDENITFLNDNPEVKSSIGIYLEKTTDSDSEAEAFAYELINIAKYFKEEYGVIGNDELNAIRMTRETKLKGYFTSAFDANYYQCINPYLEVDTQNPAMAYPIHMYYTIQCAILKAQHPQWSNWHIYAVASLELIHMGLDIAGLVPGAGEIADLTNGAIYSIEGDGLNATLSFSATIPIAGWFSTGVKYANKVINITSTSKTTLKWIVNANGVITFGKNDYCRKQLRKVLNLTDVNKQAHHIIPWGKSLHPVVQKAAQSNNAFHLNEALNGIAVSTTRHNGSHANYDNIIVGKLNDFLAKIRVQPQINAIIN